MGHITADLFTTPTPIPTACTEEERVNCNQDKPGPLAVCAGQQLSAGHITESEFNTLIWQTLDHTDKDSNAYVIGLETSPHLQFVMGSIKHHVYNSVYKIAITYPRYGKAPGLITHITPATRAAVILTDSIEQFLADLLRINQYDWGTKEVPQLYASPGSSDCTKIMAIPDLKHLVDWKNTQLILPVTTKCYAELHTIFDIYVGIYMLKKIMRAGVLTEIYVPITEKVLLPPFDNDSVFP